MSYKSFLIFTVNFVILGIVSGLARPIPISTSGSSNLRLMGRGVTYFNHDVAITSSFPASNFLRDPDELPITREERFHHQLTQSHQRMQMGTVTHTPVTAADE
ncbi:hypothetical protein BYT27DRAFT_6778603 [Phlegmacium glaucopus]|nr:hypothetical protein BYT27DRAFT_6778603 [Phlegmacium glaucopus]